MNFDERCYALLKRVPKGRVVTYKQLAEALGTKAYRAVENAMNRNPNAPKVPCHRVVCSDGSVGGYKGGAQAKISLLKKEGIDIENQKIALDKYCLRQLPRIKFT